MNTGLQTDLKPYAPILYQTSYNHVHINQLKQKKNNKTLI